MAAAAVAVAALAALSSIAMPGQAYAYSEGGSNLAAFSYPEPSCSRPARPVKPAAGASKAQLEAHGRSVEFYNEQVAAYFRCVKVYVENADNDIRRIQLQMGSVVEEAREAAPAIQAE